MHSQACYLTPGPFLDTETSETWAGMGPGMRVSQNSIGIGGGAIPSGLAKISYRKLEWEPLILSQKGLVNQPRQLSEFKHEASLSADQTSITEQKTWTNYSYDDPAKDPRQFLNMQTDYTEKLVLKASPGGILVMGSFPNLDLQPSALVYKRYRRHGPDFYSSTTTAFKWNAAARLSGNQIFGGGSEGQWEFDPSASSVDVAPGQPPGGIQSGGGELPDEEREGGLAPSIDWPSPDPIEHGTPLGAEQLNAEANTDGEFTYNPPAGTILAAGSTTLTALFTPSDPAYRQVQASTSITVTKKIPTITWPEPDPIYVGTVIGPTQLNATVDLPGSLVYRVPRGGHLLAGNNQTLSVDFLPANDSIATASKSVTIDVLKLVVPTIDWPTPDPIVFGTPLGPTHLNAVAMDPDLELPVSGNYEYTPAAGMVLGKGSRTLKVVFNPDNTQHYTEARGSTTVLVQGVPDGKLPEIEWLPAGPLMVGTPLGADQLNAVATDPDTFEAVPGSYDYNPGVGIVLSAGMHTLHLHFIPDDPAVYQEVNVSVTIEIGALIVPEIDWPPPADIDYPAPLTGAQLNATALDPDSGDPVSGDFAYTPGVGKILTAGSHTLRVVFTPNNTAYYAIAKAQNSISVTGIPPGTTPSVSWSPEGPIPYGTPLGPEQLNALVTDPFTEAAIPGEYSYDPPLGTILTVGSKTLHLLFIPTDDVLYAEVKATAGVQITKTVANITWDQPDDINEGVALSSTQLNATADVPGSFVYSPGAGLLLAPGSHTLRAIFTPSSPYVPSITATVVLRVIHVKVTWSKPASIAVGTALDDTQLNASANVEGTFDYNPPAGTVAGSVGVLRLSVTFTPKDGGFQVLKAVSITVTEAAAGAGAKLGPYVSVQFQCAPEKTAPPVSYSDINLDLGTLQLMGNQICKASALWQWEITFTGVNIPWLRRGDVVQLTGLLDEAQQPLALPPALIQTFADDYDEVGNLSHVRQYKALAWTAEETL